MSIDLLFADFDRLIQSSESVHRLRRFILDLAVRGKLVPQDPNDEPASELLKRIATEKARLVKAGVIKKAKPQSTNMPDAPFTLPAGWVWSTVGELCSKTGSGSTQEAARIHTEKKELSFSDLRMSMTTSYDSTTLPILTKPPTQKCLQPWFVPPICF